MFLRYVFAIKLPLYRRTAPACAGLSHFTAPTFSDSGLSGLCTESPSSRCPGQILTKNTIGLVLPIEYIPRFTSQSIAHYQDSFGEPIQP